MSSVRQLHTLLFMSVKGGSLGSAFHPRVALIPTSVFSGFYRGSGRTQRWSRGRGRDGRIQGMCPLTFLLSPRDQGPLTLFGTVGVCLQTEIEESILVSVRSSTGTQSRGFRNPSGRYRSLPRVPILRYRLISPCLPPTSLSFPSSFSTPCTDLSVVLPGGSGSTGVHRH